MPIKEYFLIFQEKFRNHKFIRNNPGLKQLIKYSIVGNAASIIDFALYISLTRVFYFWHERYLLTNLFTMIIATIFRFTFHKKWTFRDKSNQTEKQFVKFLLISFFSLVVSEIILYITVEHLATHDILGKLIALLLVTFFAFGVTKLWVFRKKNLHISMQKKY